MAKFIEVNGAGGCEKLSSRKGGGGKAGCPAVGPLSGTFPDVHLFFRLRCFRKAGACGASGFLFEAYDDVVVFGVTGRAEGFRFVLFA